MSFGSSVRFEATRAEDGRPKIFWEQARDVRPKKKFDYKKKEQKFSLRPRRDQFEVKSESKSALKDPVKAEPKPRTGSNDARRNVKKKEPAMEPEPVLSLTEAQLAKMLETIGKVNKSHPLRISIDKDTHQITLMEEDDKENQSEDGGEKKKGKRKKKNSSKLSKEGSSLSAKSGDTQKTEDKEDDEKVNDGDDDDTENKEKSTEKDETESKETKKEGEEESSPKPDTESTPVVQEERKPIRYLSLSEKKRLQWELERAEEVKSYNPWGKPGAGAPITTSHGDVLADYNSRKPQVVQEQIALVSPRSQSNQVQGQTGSNEEQDGKPAEQEKAAPGPAPDLPPAMRSSFAIGALSPDENRYQSKKELEKKKWLQELEQQIQEKKDREQQIKVQKVSSPRVQASVQASVQSPRHVQEHEVGGEDHVRLSLTQDLHNQVLVPTFVRGANAMLDPETMKELEEKRRRQVEHQKAVQAQVEEKQRLKREAEQKKIAEDLKEEQRLQEERDRMNNQYLQEQARQKRKQEEQTVRVQRLKEAMDEAEFVAKQEKHLKRLQHLQQHGHDTTRYHQSFEAQNTPRFAQSLRATTTIVPSVNADVAVEPNYVPGLDLTSRSHQLPSNQDYYHGNTSGYHGNASGYYGNEDESAGNYVENRTLTPSKLRRHTALSDPDIYSSKREFGTQTNLESVRVNEVNDTRKPRETSAGIEFQKDKLLDIKRSERVKKVRVLSAQSAPSKKRSPQKPQKPQKVEKQLTQPLRQRGPEKWNYQNQLHKKPLKQSEKDPNYARRRQESLQRRQQRAMELQAMVIANQDRIPANRSRSRSLSPKQARTRSKSPKQVRARSKSPGEQTQRRSRLESHEYNQWARAERQEEGRRKSPPVPAVRHRLPEEPVQPVPSDTAHPDTQGDLRGHYHDHLPTYAPLEDGEFIPFLRSSAFLDPSESQRPLPVSREPTGIEQGRKAYAQNQKPGVYGAKMNHIQDTGLENLLSNDQPQQKNIKKDPITQPNLVKDHPTSRQEMILQQLSDIRKNLLLKQREIETCLSPADLHAGRT